MKRLATTILLCVVFSVKAQTQTVITKHFDPAPPTSPPVELPQDCGIIAAAAYNRLKPVTPFCQVLTIRGLRGKVYVGHAGVVFQYQPRGEVFFYDAKGTRGLGTHSTDIGDIREAFSHLLHAFNPLTVTFQTQ